MGLFRFEYSEIMKNKKIVVGVVSLPCFVKIRTFLLERFVAERF